MCRVRRSPCCSGAGPVVAAVVTRCVFALHCGVAVSWIMTSSAPHPLYWMLNSGLVGLCVEAVVTIYMRGGAEYKWFCPSVFCYLLTIIPCVWVLELDQLAARIHARDQQQAAAEEEDGTAASDLQLFEGVSVSVPVAAGDMAQVLEQLLLFVLVGGRWLLPRGDISRDELSQLLLVYIGMGADIIEFFEAFSEDEVMYDYTLTVVILVIWSLSLMQFTLVLTASKSKKTRAGYSGEAESETESEFCCSCCSTEVFGILTTMFLQDGPFCVLRLLLIIDYSVRSYMHIFFTVKNVMMLFLIFYRLYTLYEVARAKKLTGETDDGKVEVGKKEDYVDLDQPQPSTSHQSPVLVKTSSSPAASSHSLGATAPASAAMEQYRAMVNGLETVTPAWQLV